MYDRTKQEKPRTDVAQERPSETDVSEYVIQQIMDDLWDRTTDLGLIHDPILMRAD